MKRRTEYIRVRLTPEELEQLMETMAKEDGLGSYGGQKNISEYVRRKIFSETDYRNQLLKLQHENIRYELRKIGTNINQVTRKINAGFGSPEDLIYLQSEIKKLIKTFEDYKGAVEKWGSPS